MSSNARIRQPGPLGWVIALVAAVALFAAGTLVGRAISDDSADTPPTDLPASGGQAAGSGSTARPVSRPGVPTPTLGGAGAPGREATDAVAPKGGAMPAYGCVAPLPDGVIGSDTISLAAAGITPRVPRSGFQLTGLNLGSTSGCTQDGQPEGDARPALSTSWRHAATGLEVYLTQSPSSDPVAPVLRQDGATFAALGYRFDAWVNAYPVRPLEGPATDTPAIAVNAADPRAAEVLRDLITQVAPGFDQQCFWKVRDGDWADLAAAGVGDPRPAIPSGLSISELHVSAFEPPAAGCDRSVTPLEGFGLYASWSSADGAIQLAVSVSGLPAGAMVDYPGYLDQYGASWTSGTLQFSIWYASKEAGDVDLLRAIAKALDPSFDDACFARQVTLQPSDLAAIGFRQPRAPEGYALVASSLTSTDIAPGCARPAGFERSIDLSWTFQRGPDTISVYVNRYEGSTGMTPGGTISDYGLYWTAANGTSYSVNGSSTGVSGLVSRDDLIAVATSLDPTLDVSKLSEEKGGAVPPQPAPERAN
ncbi:hypothetical protein [Tepidiforma sp.]|uniref:hypothetical protein n=1 Tax=Tepidiforma sp. TaxID=2682230 RepID=UPI002ADE278A|nr:hypothetical protein [Tepidiforma sp.]